MRMSLTHNGDFICKHILYLRERHYWGPISQTYLWAHSVFLAFIYCNLLPTRTFLIIFLCFCCSWDLPLSLSCFRNKFEEGVSECAPSQWVILTLAIADKRTPLICTQEVIIKHSSNIFNEKNLCIKMLLLSLGTWRPMGRMLRGAYEMIAFGSEPNFCWNENYTRLKNKGKTPS